jgi:TonB family protein
MNVHYPEAAEKAGTQGRVLVKFIIEEDGTISDAKVVRKVSDELDAEALRVVSAMPKWTPGRQNGQPVRVNYTMPVTFRLQ